VTSLSVSGLYKSFDEDEVLTGVDVHVPAGSHTAILGPSGSGKTTLLRVVAGFERADAGQVTLGDKVVDGPDAFVPPERRRIGYVPQEGSLFPHLNVEKNVGFGLPRSARRGETVRELLEMVGLAGLGRRYPHELSGGQQQRVALARALAVGPAVVLLDEPFTSLDASMRASVRADVFRVLRDAGTTAVLVTHDQDEALSMADQVAVLHRGRISQLAAPHDLYARPADADVASFVGEANLVPGVMEGAWVRTALGLLPLAGPAPAPSGADVVVLVRPEQVELARYWAGEGGLLSGRVVEFEYFGHDAVVRVAPEAEQPGGPIVVRTAGGAAWVPGAHVGLRAKGPVVAWATAASSTSR